MKNVFDNNLVVHVMIKEREASLFQTFKKLLPVFIQMIDILIYISTAVGYGRWCYRHWNTLKSHPIHRFDLLVSLIGTTTWMTCVIVSQSIGLHTIIPGFMLSFGFNWFAFYWMFLTKRQIRQLMHKQQWNMTRYFAERHVRCITKVLLDQSMILFVGSVTMCAWFVPMPEADGYIEWYIDWYIIFRTWASRILWVSLVWCV